MTSFYTRLARVGLGGMLVTIAGLAGALRGWKWG